MNELYWEAFEILYWKAFEMEKEKRNLEFLFNIITLMIERILKEI